MWTGAARVQRKLTRRTKARMLKHSRPNVTNFLGVFLGFVLVVPPINRQLMAIISHRFWRSHTSFDILASICFVAVATAST